MSETTPAMTTTPITPTMPALPVLPAGWMALVCQKCGADFHVRPADDRGMQALRALDVEDDLNDWRSGPACPLCAHARGGNYPLARKLQEGERAALNAHQAATLAAYLAAEPPTPLDGCSSEEDAAWSEALDKYDRLQWAWGRATKALMAFGYSRAECGDIGQYAIDVRARDAVASARAAG